MPKVVMYGRCVPENMEISLENLRNGSIGLNATSHVRPFQEGT
jgi:hypothetical protein